MIDIEKLARENGFVPTEHSDGEITATVNKDFALIVEADGFEVTQLYAKKG